MYNGPAFVLRTKNYVEFQLKILVDNDDDNDDGDDDGDDDNDDDNDDSSCWKVTYYDMSTTLSSALRQLNHLNHLGVATISDQQMNKYA